MDKKEKAALLLRKNELKKELSEVTGIQQEKVSRLKAKYKEQTDYLKSAMASILRKRNIEIGKINAEQQARRKEIQQQLMEINYALKIPNCALMKAEKREREIAEIIKNKTITLSCSVEQLPLGIRERRALRRMSIYTVKELVCRTENELLSVCNFGRKSLSELNTILQHGGLSLGMQFDSANEPE